MTKGSRQRSGVARNQLGPDQVDLAFDLACHQIHELEQSAGLLAGGHRFVAEAGRRAEVPAVPNPFPPRAPIAAIDREGRQERRVLVGELALVGYKLGQVGRRCVGSPFDGRNGTSRLTTGVMPTEPSRTSTRLRPVR